VDFTKDNPRSFRLGVFGERDIWNPENQAPDEYPAFEQRLVIVSEPPFAADRWTHVAIAFEHLGQSAGHATLYLDGEAQGSSQGIAESFAWDMATATIRLGVNYVGLYDELAVFNRPLSADEIETLGELERGVASLYQ
jgi:hypothetical protein